MTFDEWCHKRGGIPDNVAKVAEQAFNARNREVKALGERCNQLIKDKGDLIDKVKELEAQIEKMKRCAICKHSTDLGYCKIRCSGGECDNHSSWEIKENDKSRT